MEIKNCIPYFDCFFSEKDSNAFKEATLLRTSEITQIINKCVFSNDLSNIILFLHKIIHIDFKIFEIPQIESIVQIILQYLKKFYKNFHFCFLAMTLLYKVYNHIPNSQSIFPAYSELFLEIFLYYKHFQKFLSKEQPRIFFGTYRKLC